MSETQIIDGQRAVVIRQAKPVPQKLTELLDAMFAVTYRDDIVPGGMSTACDLRNHRWKRFREGRHLGLDGIVRDVALRMCADCGAVDVRDISFQTSLDGERVPLGGRGPNRIDAHIAFYTGARRRGRTYS